MFYSFVTLRKISETKDVSWPLGKGETLENKTNKYFALMRSKDAKWCWYFHDSFSIDLHYLVDDFR